MMGAFIFDFTFEHKKVIQFLTTNSAAAAEVQVICKRREKELEELSIAQV